MFNINSRLAPTMSRALTVGVLLLTAGVAAGQVRMSFPGTGMPSHGTPTPTGLPLSRPVLSPRPTTGFIQRPVVGSRPVIIQRPVLGGQVIGRGPVVCDPNPGCHDICHPGLVTTGSGLTVNGRFVDDNFNLGFHFGNPLITNHCKRVSPCVVFPSCGFPNGWTWWGGWGWGWDNYIDNSYLRYNVIDGSLVQPAVYQPPATQPVTQTPAPPPTTLERAQTMLRAGRVEEAVSLFQDHLRTKKDDAGAMRSLAIALLRSGEPVQAGAMMRMAYRADPGLAETPLDLNGHFGDDGDIRQSLVRAVKYANESESASGWLVVAVLMQAEGRNSHAARMLTKASAEGLEDAVVESLTTALD
jgi:hypothetical protein